MSSLSPSPKKKTQAVPTRVTSRSKNITQPALDFQQSLEQKDKRIAELETQVFDLESMRQAAASAAADTLLAQKHKENEHLTEELRSDADLEEAVTPVSNLTTARCSRQETSLFAPSRTLNIPSSDSEGDSVLITVPPMQELAFRPGLSGASTREPSRSASMSSLSPSPKKKSQAIPTRIIPSKSKSIMQPAIDLHHSLEQKDKRIAELEAQVLDLESMEHAAALAAADALLAQKHKENEHLTEDLGIDADLEEVLQKSENLLHQALALDAGVEVKQQWTSIMAVNEDRRERLARIEALVTKRSEQLQPGDAELKLCRSVRGLCTGTQKLTRKWSTR